MKSKRTMRFAREIWISVALVFYISPVGATTIKDSKLTLPSTYSQTMYWLDNKRVIALIFENELWTAPDGSKKGVESIVVWDVESNEYARHGLPGASGLCVGDGFIRYFRRRLSEGKYDEIDRYYGQFGKEEKISLTGTIDKDTCLIESELPRLPAGVEVRKETKGSWFVRLKPEHGWVEFAKRSGDPPHVLRQYPAAIIPPGAHAEGGIALPEFFRETLKRISRYDSTLPYYPYRNAYVLRTMHYQSPLPEGVRTTLWWIYPNGRVEEIVSYTRDKSWPLANENSFIPARSGIYFIGADTTLTSYVGLYGLFRYFDDNKRKRIVAGRIRQAVLSPDGCKLAFGNDDRRRVDGARQYKLQVIDLCEGEEK